MSKYKKTNIIADICKLMNTEEDTVFKEMKCIELLALKMKLVKDLKNSSLKSTDDDDDSCDFAQRAGCAR